MIRPSLRQITLLNRQITSRFHNGRKLAVGPDLRPGRRQSDRDHHPHSRPREQKPWWRPWSDDDYDVREGSRVIGRIMKRWQISKRH